jgi:methyltransferase (TIGR00027 family)
VAETAASSAYGPIVLSASEQALPQEERIIDDPLAYHFLPAYMRLMIKALKTKPLRRWFFKQLEKETPGISAAILCRKRYIENKLLESLDAGVDSVVILGAGLDTLAYRLPQLSALSVYEVDLPENISYKMKALQALYGSVPEHVCLVPLDFETQTLASELQSAGYSFDRLTFFIWEGVTQYLTEAAVRETFQFLAQARPGSRLVFTYVLRSFIEGTETYGLDRLYRRMRVNHQYWQFGFDPREVSAFINGYGWEVLEQTSAAEYVERCLRPVGRTEPISGIEPAIFAEKVSS